MKHASVIHSLSLLSQADLYVLGGAAISGLLWLFDNLSFTKKYHTVILSFVLPILAVELQAALTSTQLKLHEGSDLYLATQAIFWSITGLIAAAKSRDQKKAPQF